MNIKRFIPNILTLLNLFCGCIAIVFTAGRNFEIAFWLVALGIFFDFFDGFFARKFGVAGPLGVQLDSLADMVTSGVVPGLAVFQMLAHYFVFSNSNYKFIAFLGFSITLGACYRLAKFNIDTRQSDSFIGLPTPANTLFIMSLPLINHSFLLPIIQNQWFLITISFISAYIMNAEIPLFSLKIKNFSFQKYKLQIGFLIASIAMLVTLQYLAIPLIIVTYVLLSVANNLMVKE